MNNQRSSKKQKCNEVRVEITRQVALATHTPPVPVPADYRTSAKRKTFFSIVDRIELTSRGFSTLAQALVNPAPAPNANLLAAMQQAKEWF